MKNYNIDVTCCWLRFAETILRRKYILNNMLRIMFHSSRFSVCIDYTRWKTVLRIKYYFNCNLRSLYILLLDCLAFVNRYLRRCSPHRAYA